MVFDKTGTLTVEQPRLVTIDVVDDRLDESELIRLAAAAESSGEHPLGRAIIDAATERSITIPPATEFTSSTGQGVAATVEAVETKSAATRKPPAACSSMANWPDA